MDNDIYSSQIRLYSGVVARGTPRESINDLYDFACDAKPPDVYAAYSEIPFLFEILHKDGWDIKVRRLVDQWVENESNIKRAADHVQRTPRNPLIGAFCIFRMKRVKHWRPSEPLGSDDPEHAQTVVFIALSDLNVENGFFTALEQGQDVCVDSKANICFPPAGGGLGIYISLNI